MRKCIYIYIFLKVNKKPNILNSKIFGETFFFLYIFYYRDFCYYCRDFCYFKIKTNK